MKKKKIMIIELIAWIISSIIILSIVMRIIDTYLFIPRKKHDYWNYLSKYEQEIIIESKVECLKVHSSQSKIFYIIVTAIAKSIRV